MLTRSSAAFLFSVRTLFELSQRPYFWTFTLRDVHQVSDYAEYKVLLAWAGNRETVIVRANSPAEARKFALSIKPGWRPLKTAKGKILIMGALTRWERFRKAIWKWGRCRKTGAQSILGLRCFELHPGGHGVHVHALFNCRLDKRLIEHIGHRYGFGFSWVVRVRNIGHAEKMADYMTKYCTKQKRPEAFKGRRMWASIGDWGATRCKDIEIESEFTEAYKARRRFVAAERECARLAGRGYQAEHQLQSMHWAQEHCFLVKIGKRRSLTGMIHEIGPKPDQPPPEYDYKDWDGLFSELATPQGPPTLAR